MAISWCNELPEGREASDDFDFKVEATRVWQLKTDDASWDAVRVLDNAHAALPDPVPNVGVEHDYLDGLYVKHRHCAQEGEDRNFFRITVNYSNQFDEDPAERQQNPLLRRVKYSLEWAQHSKLLVRDANRVQILNTVHDRFDEPLEIDDARPVLVAVRNEDAADLASIIALAVDYKDKINSDLFYGASVGCVKMGCITTGEPIFENGVWYYAVRYEFHFKEPLEPGKEGWLIEILNRGNRAYATADDSFSRYRLKDGPKNLNEDGTVCDPNDDPHYVEVNAYVKRPFAALGL